MLDARYFFWGSASKKGIAVVQSVQNATADKRGFSQKLSNDANIQIGRATEIAQLLAHCQIWIEKDTKIFFQMVFK